MREAVRELVSRLDSINSREELESEKKRIARKHHVMLGNSDIIEALSEEDKERYRELLQIKRTRTAAGVSVVAVMTSPAPCPHGRCVYCPGGVKSPQSYTGGEPAALRAAQYDYDPFAQTKARIEQLERTGHPTDKIELIIMGGTFTARDKGYKERFVKECYDAMNEDQSSSIEEAVKKNEKTRHRCIGITLETRPDFFMKREINEALSFGATKVELGVQTVFDDILEKVGRKHGTSETAESTALARDAGFKICYHMMPGLPYSDESKDLQSFRKIFEDDRFKPDMLKIYPTLVIKGTALYDMWKKGEYTPMDEERAIDLLSKVKSFVPPWVRIQRIERDVPVKNIEAGIRRSDIRELIHERMTSEGKECRCIRCREAGFKKTKRAARIELLRMEYNASKAREVFLSFEDIDNDIILGYLRLRLMDEPMIRELKVVGQELPLGAKSTNSYQHRGYGKELVAEAEHIATEEGYDSIRIICGPGVREYYRKIGYSLEGYYMRKVIAQNASTNHDTTASTNSAS
jgi:elongator complex protein 3